MSNHTLSRREWTKQDNKLGKRIRHDETLQFNNSSSGYPPTYFILRRLLEIESRRRCDSHTRINYADCLTILRSLKVVSSQWLRNSMTLAECLLLFKSVFLF